MTSRLSIRSFLLVLLRVFLFLLLHRVSGFYGRPWTYPQRKELFRRMNQMGMNAYLYAPKDDIKHRQSWRDLYTPEEEQQLQYLITESTDAGVLFIFAISPGLDVTFSSAKEVDILKKKVDQVAFDSMHLMINLVVSWIGRSAVCMWKYFLFTRRDPLRECTWAM
ncbi:unnamed protein product [Trichobilharzia regenti]|nr:unnamed protein product [Trichobilharzia regenti]